MKSEWRKVRLGDVCDITSSKRIFAKEYQTFGVPFYRGKEIIEKQRGNSISTELFIGTKKYNEISNRFGVPVKGDILLTSVGTLGVPYVVRNEQFYFKDGNLTWFRNFRNADSRFLYYWFLSPDAKHQIDTKCIGSTQKALTIETLLKFIIPLPPLTTQRAIAATLSCLDEKIELNNHINANLEAQAQAIFKSWFVDFEPFKDGKFVDSELGRIPKGWRVGTLSDLVNIKYGKAHQSLDNGIVPVYGSGGLLRYAEKYLYDKESVLIPRKGTLNNVMYIKEPFWVVDTMFYTEIKHPHVLFFVYQFLKNKDLASMNTGTAVPSMTIEILNSLLTIVPNDDVLYNYNKTVSILYDQIIMNIRQSHILADIRDALMPKLMSGEVEVEE